MKSGGISQSSEHWLQWSSTKTGENTNNRPGLPWPHYFTPSLTLAAQAAAPWTYLNRSFVMPDGFLPTDGPLKRSPTPRNSPQRSSLAPSDPGRDAHYGSRASIRLDRPFLHATHLAFDHPITGERLAFDDPLPPELTKVLEALA